MYLALGDITTAIAAHEGVSDTLYERLEVSSDSLVVLRCPVAFSDARWDQSFNSTLSRVPPAKRPVEEMGSNPTECLYKGRIEADSLVKCSNQATGVTAKIFDITVQGARLT